MADLLINNKDALATWGVRIGAGFLDALIAPCQMKEYIENESRLENGKRVLTSNAKVASREITLAFTIEGSSEADYRSKKNAFFQELYKGSVTVAVPKNGSEVYRLVYTGKSASYGQSLDRTFGKFSAKFEETNPMNRG